MCFFFSSRRRHTRYIGDWSSDVCSSDLSASNRAFASSLDDYEREAKALFDALQARDNGALWNFKRSEERRVGKEGGIRPNKKHHKYNERGSRRTHEGTPRRAHTRRARWY